MTLGRKDFSVTRPTAARTSFAWLDFSVMTI